MKQELIYTQEEILDVATKMYDDYEMVFIGKEVPKAAVTNLAKMLSEYDFINDKKLIALEYAARVKYEIENYVGHVNIKTSKDPRYFPYKNNEFAVKQTLLDIYGYNNEEEKLPKLIKYCLSNAFFEVYHEYGEDVRTLKLTNK